MSKYALILVLVSCGSSDWPEPGSDVICPWDSTGPITCGQLGDTCCVATVCIDEVCGPVPVCHHEEGVGDLACEDGTCVPITATVDAGTSCGLLGQECCLNVPQNSLFCYEPYACDGEVCR